MFVLLRYNFKSFCVSFMSSVWDTHVPLLLQKMRCSDPNCSADLVDPCGHPTCRTHSFCSFEVDGVLVWIPDDCHTCYSYWTTLSSDTVRVINTFLLDLHCMFLLYNP